MTYVDPVLKDQLNSNLSGDVARGGSTTTRQRPAEMVLINATDVTGGASSPAVQASPSMDMDMEAIPAVHVDVNPERQEVEVVSTAVSKKVLKQEKKQEKKLAKLEKKEKKHKHIAKKLKVRCWSCYFGDNERRRV